MPRLAAALVTWNGPSLIQLCLAAPQRHLGALLVGLVDHYYFNIEFPHMAALLWLTSRPRPGGAPSSVIGQQREPPRPER